MGVAFAVVAGSCTSNEDWRTLTVSATGALATPAGARSPGCPSSGRATPSYLVAARGVARMCGAGSHRLALPSSAALSGAVCGAAVAAARRRHRRPKDLADGPRARRGALTARGQPTGKTAIVVGAGVGGLAVAGRLARAGLQVTLLEKNESTGGRLRSETFETEGLKGHRFDTGPSLLLMPEKYREAFAALGARMEDYVTLKKVEPTALRVHYAEDWSTLDLLSDSEAMKQQLEQVEPGAGAAYTRWLAEAKASLDLGVKAFIEQESTSALDFVNPMKVGPLALAVNPIRLLGPQAWQLSAHFKSNKIKALFSYQQLYVGLRPQNAPGIFSLLAATELADGIWYPVGGFGTVRDALQHLAEAHGVAIRTGSEVSKIIVNGTSGSGLQARGVQLRSGERLEADVVVANADLPYAYDELLRGQFQAAEAEAEQVTKGMEFSCSMIEFCWALKEPLPQLAQHNVFLGRDYEGSWDRPCTVEDFRSRHSYNFYVHRPTCTDPTAAPEGQDCIMVELPVGNFRERRLAAERLGQASMDSDEALVEAAREAVLRQLSRAGCQASGGGSLKALIKGERVIPPSEWQRRYNLMHGATFGLSHGLLQLACFRPPRQTGIPGLDSTKVQGLHFVGASTRPGNGVPLVLMGANTTVGKILAELGVVEQPGLPVLPAVGAP